MKDLELTLEVLCSTGRSRGKNPASVALDYNLSKGIVPDVGIRNPSQAQDVINAFEWTLSAEEINNIDEVSMNGKTTKLWQQG
jgi:diketogulonate reductase-like aldo/keto reductase